ncbi:MAG: imidazole glycerol phosphate synthase subunit HisH [Gammaproteobacteria bacterium]|nr:MAG: imidazole glycerol phosphate synthase subunit HisH [Gammaproteobacteria bacterium]
MKKIVILDYDSGNLHSVAKAITQVADNKTQILISDKHEHIKNADRIIFPGQGAAADCMRKLKEHNLIDEINYAIKNKPFLGICMGMQVLFQKSSENNGTDLLNIYQGEVKDFKKHIKKDFKIPHMGWNNVKQMTEHPLWNNIKDNSSFYFVHSYFASPQQKNIITGTSLYDIDFCSVIACENVFACQFHPEKSTNDGLQLLKNFINWQI